MGELGKLPHITALMARRLRCPGCLRRYRAQDIATVESGARFGVFRLRCPMCASDRLVIGVWNRNAVRTYTTDLDVQEWLYYRRAQPVNADDVLRIHAVLCDYDGDFSDVLEDPFLSEGEA